MTDIETITELREQLKLATSWRLRAQTEVVELTKALRVAKDALYNGFEPDNQSEAWHIVNAAINKVNP